ncbi:hypothetical protein D0Z07_8685 [Hyphodiscus hymeniophilus]|uniref:Glycoside hydrolase family 78 protein n=1 Tax=Hyphodiscus hymeniophilus TaxID=353542 RepID=A0A9P6SQ61_9HELO|nr:hypothetical protein D0Z07_8685 [Hyphodiscus hymeniophilus]
MFLITTLIALSVVLTRSCAAAQSCWRNTVCTGATQPAFPGHWESYNYSPTSRTVQPTRILKHDKSFLANYPGIAQLNGNGSQLIFDFGKEVGGIITVSYSASGSGTLGLAFTEAKNWTGQASDSSSGTFRTDGALSATITTTNKSSYTMPDNKMRGGFRYLTLFALANKNIDIQILNITLELSFQPAWSNLQAYGGYFYSNDDLLNKVWWSGAYTLQTNAIPPTSGRHVPILGSGWLNDMNLNLGTSGSTIYVDGAKRDRTVWSGDLAIAVPSILQSTGDSVGVKNALLVLYNDQATTGELPFAGPAMNIFGSDTYHMAVMIGTYDYYLYSGDKTFLSSIWFKYQSAMSFITAEIDSTGLLYVPANGVADWGRSEQVGRNTEANMLLYHTLVTGSSLATWIGNQGLASEWTSLAARLKSAVNSPSLNWDPTVGAFKNNDTDATIHPEDGNSMALVFNVANTSYIQSISQELTKNWGPIGAVAPELPGNVVGFTQSFEVKGHFVSRQATRALSLIRLSWGWYLNNPFGTQSTCIEGYLSDGTFGYRADEGYQGDASYTSHAHGWSTGPTSALTTYIVGIQLTGPGGITWTLAPQFGDLIHAEAGFITPLGKYSASWTLATGGYTVSWEFPQNTKGNIVLPGQTAAEAPSLSLDGKKISLGAGEYNPESGLLTIDGQGGSHTLQVIY